MESTKIIGNPNRRFSRKRKPAAKGTCFCPVCNKWVKVANTEVVRQTGTTGFIRICTDHANKAQITGKPLSGPVTY